MEFGKLFFCVNAQTKVLHSEDDCSYTVITVPNQRKLLKNTNYNFTFQFNPNHSIYLEMDKPITFMFSGKFLAHQQLYNSNNEVTDDTFINFGTYTNKKIFSHVKKSFERVKEAKI